MNLAAIVVEIKIPAWYYLVVESNKEHGGFLSFPFGEERFLKCQLMIAKNR